MMWLAVGVGGALGSMARHGVNVFFAHVLERSVPYATAVVNLFGSAVIGPQDLRIVVCSVRLQPGSSEIRLKADTTKICKPL